MEEIKRKIQSLLQSKSEEDRRACLPLLANYLADHPNDAAAWYDKAGCHDYLGEEKEAEPCYQRCLELGWQKLPADEQKNFFVGYGSTLRNNQKLEESIAVLREGTKQFPDFAPLKIFLALSLYSAGQDRQAAKILFPACIEVAAQGLGGFDRAIQYYVNNLPEKWEGAGEALSQPRIETDRLVLEPYQPTDLDDVFAYAGDPEVTKFLLWDHHRTKEDSRRFLVWVKEKTSTAKEKLFFVFAMRSKETGRVIGSIDFKHTNPYCGQIDYVCGREYWGKGLMTEAARSIRDWAWGNLPDLVRLQAFCMVENVASARVMEKVGMQSEGIKRKGFLHKGKPVDIKNYALLR